MRRLAMMTRRRHLAAATHQMAAIPDVFAYDAWARIGSDGCECCGKCHKQDERYKFAHRSILE